jgi:hypothetical protein
MKTEEQRIAIAEACGWTEVCLRPYSLSGNYNVPMGFREGVGPRIVPNYPADLNAMHEAEKVEFGTDEIAWGTYGSQLFTLIEPSRHYLHATAAQRAEAFLRTIGKWEDGK